MPIRRRVLRVCRQTLSLQLVRTNNYYSIYLLLGITNGVDFSRWWTPCFLRGYGLLEGAVLLNPTSDVVGERLRRDAEYLRGHIAAASFWSDVTCNSFVERHPDAARAWALLQPQFVSCRGQSASATSADSTFAAAWPKRKLDGPPGKKELRAALKRHKSFQH